MSKPAVEGGCICGAVRFSATGEPNHVCWCHLQSRRRHSRAPVLGFVGYALDADTVTLGEIAKLKWSPGTTRGCCRTCGSTLTCESEMALGETHFHVDQFDQLERFAPTRHLSREEQLPWLHLAERIDG